VSDTIRKWARMQRLKAVRRASGLWFFRAATGLALTPEGLPEEEALHWLVSRYTAAGCPAAALALSAEYEQERYQRERLEALAIVEAMSQKGGVTSETP
jgi:hypothetical protein